MKALTLVAALALLAAAPLPPPQEARAHALFREVRCVVCQNESIDDSEAELAGDLRGLVRGKIAAGRSDAEIRRFLTDRYGEFVLLKPRLSPGNALLWGAPFAIVLGGLGAFALHARRRPATDEPPLSEAEAARVSGITGRGEEATLPPQSGPTIGVGGAP